MGASNSHDNDPTLENCLFRAVTLTKNADINRYLSTNVTLNYLKLLETLLKLTQKGYSKLLKIVANVIQIEPQALLKTNFKGVTKLKNLFAKTAQLKPQTK